MILVWLFQAIYATIAAEGLALLFGKLTPWIASISLFIGAFFGRRHAKTFRKANPDWRLWSFGTGMIGILEMTLTTFVLYACLRHFIWIFFRMDAGWFTLSINNFGDLPLHINFIRAFAQGLEFPPLNPIFMSEALRYPIGADLYNALWESLGFSTAGHLAIVGIIGAMATVMLLRSFAGWWGIGAFFLNGGLVGLSFLIGQASGDLQNGVEWKNLLLSVFVTQRGMLFALPIGLILLMSLRRHLSSAAGGSGILTRQQLFSLGLLWGFFPLFHLHSFLIVSIMMAGIALEHGGWRGVWAFLKSRMALVAYLPAMLFVLYSTDFLRKASVAHWRWGWVYGEKFPERFIDDFGFWLLLPPLIAFLLWWKGNGVAIALSKEARRKLWVEFAVYLGLFALFMNLMLAPWDWDNIKLLIWPYLGFARLASVVIEPQLGRLTGRYLGTLSGVVERGLLATVLFAAGFHAVVASIESPARRSVQIYPTSEIASTEGALSDIPKNAVFASASTHNHSLTYFGRLRAVGYEGHLWSHGIEAQNAIRLQRKIWNGDADWFEAAKSLGATHIFWGPQERAAFGATRRPWMDVLPNVSRVREFEIYAVDAVSARK